MKLFIIITTLFLSLNIKADEQVIKIIAVIGDEIITNYDLAQKIKLIELNSNKEVPKEHLKAVNNQVREQLISEVLYNIAAKNNGLIASEEQVNTLNKSYLKDKNLKEYEFLRILKDKEIDYKSFKSQLQTSLNWQNILYYIIRPKIKISDTEINDYIQNIADENNDFEYLVQIINFPINENKYETESLLNDIYKKIQTNKISFQEISASYSLSKIEEPVWKLKSEFDENIQTNLTIMTDDELSKPIKYKDSYKLLFLKEKRLKKNKNNNKKFRNEIKQKLYMKKLESAANRYSEQLKKNTYIERKIF
ncbi:MAG: SurA N-terminal domain-containing protein [Rickettsiales bacterium]|nr:SurA N-terminal domain-containing protein [Rickettsiales bacterium]